MQTAKTCLRLCGNEILLCQTFFPFCRDVKLRPILALPIAKEQWLSQKTVIFPLVTVLDDSRASSLISFPLTSLSQPFEVHFCCKGEF